MAVGAEQHKVKQGPAARLRSQVAVPIGPVAMSAQRDGQAFAKVGIAVDQAAGRRGKPEIDQQPVLRGHGVKSEHGVVAAGKSGCQHGLGRGIDPGAALCDRGRPDDCQDVALAVHGRFDRKPVDAQSTQRQIDVGQQGLVGRQRRGRPQHG
jgi:hypothetical protein